MTTTEPPATPTRRPPPRFRRVQVRAVQALTPHMVRITVGGDELADYASRGPAEHIRLFFPAPGSDEVSLPKWGENGPYLEPGQSRPVSRVYTPRRWDADARELTIDVVLHGEGPGATWAAQAQPGQPIVVAGPGGGFRFNPEARWYVLAGDQTAIPAISTLIEALPADLPVQVYLEVPGAEEQPPLPAHPLAQVTWLHNPETTGPAGTVLENTLLALALPAGPGQVWLACEAMRMRRLRQHWLHGQGLPRDQVYTHGYWKYGVANHSDHDRGDDD